MSRRAVVALATAALVAACAGCAISKSPRHDEITRRALPPETEIPETWQAPARTGPVAGDWLAALDDPTLEALVAEAIANNRDLIQAAERVRVAQQAVVIAGARMRPRVDAGVGGRSTIDSGNDDSFESASVYAGVGWEMDVWGKLRAQRAATEASAQATALDYAFARQSLAATVAKAWYLACEARQLLELSEQAVAIYDNLLALVKTRRTSGRDSDLNVVDTRAKLALARAEVESSRAAYDAARRALETLLGRYPSAEVEAASDFPPLPPPPSAGAPAALLEHRPDLMAAEQRVLSAFRREESARLALRPAFSISLTVGRLGSQLLSLLQLNPWLASANVGMAIPIYEGGSLKARVEIATAQQAAAVAAYGAVALSAFREVEDALANERYIAQRLPYTEAALADSTEAVRIATVQYRAGRRDLLWVSNIQTGQIAIHADVIRTLSLQRTNRIRLYLSLGGSFDEEPVVPDLDELLAEIAERESTLIPVPPPSD
jgi:NodT family efflux transporter outer membrane factor (OMF) lipoprotein